MPSLRKRQSRTVFVMTADGAQNKQQRRYQPEVT